MGEDCKRDSSADALPTSLSSQASKDLLALLLSRGYFHGNTVTPIQADPSRNNPNDEDDTANNPIPRHSEADGNCQIVLLENKNASSEIDEGAYCCTYPVLKSNLANELKKAGGRCGVTHLVAALNLQDEIPLVRIVEEQRSDTQALFQLGEDIYSSLYLDRISKQIFETLLSKETILKEKVKGVKTAGCALISDLALLDFHLPMDAAVAALTERIPHVTDIQMIKLDAGPAIVSEGYITQLKKDVMKAFGELQEPTSIANVCRDHHWDVGLVAKWVNDACHDQSLPGDIHGGEDEISLMSGRVLYTPIVHVQALRQAVDGYYASQGYMTATKGTTLGLSKSKMADYIQESFPSALVVSDSLVVNPETILRPLEAILEEAIAMDSFVDLSKDHIPLEILMEQEEDARALLNQHALPTVTKQKESKTTKSGRKGKSQSSLGVVVIASEHGGLYVSEGMVSNIEKKLLPDLIAIFAKKRAEEVDLAELAGDNVKGPKSTSVKSKGDRKGKKTSKTTSEDNSNESEHTEDVVPLIDVVRSILSEYEELAELDPALKEALDDVEHNNSMDQLQWDKAAHTGKGKNISGASGDISCDEGLLCRFCYEAFYTEELLSKCQKAIQVELKRLQSVRASKASVSRKDAATTIRNAETSFEKAFNEYCFLVQTQAKFIDYVKGCEGDNDALVEKLTADFLEGTCADFTRNLTLYCIFKHELDPDVFHFTEPNAEPNAGDGSDYVNDNTIPLYCLGPNIEDRKAPKTFISFKESQFTKEAKEPLPKLRELLPGSVGVSLARQWVMCGGSCYHGGTKIDECGSFSRPGDLEKLLAHLEENCLSLCGFPFKKIDKKSEKQFLFTRRQALLRLLESNDDATRVLDLTIVLLFQQVKNVVAFGSTLHDSNLLKLLAAERKISEEVAAALFALAKAVKEDQDGANIDASLVETVRACGLSKDIAKHQLA